MADYAIRLFGVLMVWASGVLMGWGAPIGNDAAYIASMLLVMAGGFLTFAGDAVLWMARR